MSRNLVFVQSKRNETEINPCCEKFDLVVCKDDGSKFQNFMRQFQDNQWNEKYDRFLIADDNLEMTSDKANKLFQASSENNLEVCGPSYFEGHVTWSELHEHCPGVKLLRSNFVELTAPVMTKEALSKLIPYWDEKILKEWGIDFLYSYLNREENMGVIHDVIVKKEVDFSEYENFQKQQTPYESFCEEKQIPSYFSVNVLSKEYV